MDCNEKVEVQKAQSAMEYLMTYGWAILVIAVVLGVLFQLGVFNSSNLGPRAQPGSCHVYRPDGTGTTNYISLEGACNGELPQYAATGQGQITISKEFLQNNSFTILAWVYWPPGTNLGSFDHGYAWSGPSTQDEGFGIFERSDHWYLNFYGDDLQCNGGPVAGKWYMFGASWNNATKNQTIWVNGALNCTRTSSGSLVTGEPLYLLSATGTWDGTAALGGGYVSNVQLYNTPLAYNSIRALYLEGIGGAPENLQNLVGWWPLNGNAQDYSGNIKNGQISGSVTFTSQWMNGYTAP